MRSRAHQAVLVLPLVLGLSSALAAQRPTLSPQAHQFVSVDDPVIAITNVRVIDGTGAPPVEGQTVVIPGREDRLGGGRSAAIPAGARCRPVRARRSSPASSASTTTATTPPRRPGGAVELPGADDVPRRRGHHHPDHRRKQPLRRDQPQEAVDRGGYPGPDVFITGPYLTGPASGRGSTMVGWPTEDGGPPGGGLLGRRRASPGSSSTPTISRAAMKAAIDEAHKPGIKFTGHLCSVPYREAVALGIDGLEHGLFANSDYDQTRKPDRCSPNLMPSFTGSTSGASRSRPPSGT